MAGRRLRPKRDRTIESELKFRLTGENDHRKLRAMLRERGARHTGRYREENYRFNGPGKSTRNTTLRLRVLNGLQIFSMDQWNSNKNCIAHNLNSSRKDAG